MSTSGELEGALTGGLWHFYFDALAHTLSDAAADEGAPPATTLDDVFTAAREAYMSECSFVVVDKVRVLPRSG